MNQNLVSQYVTIMLHRDISKCSVQNNMDTNTESINQEIEMYLSCLSPNLSFQEKFQSAISHMNDTYDMNPNDEANFRAVIIDELQKLEKKND